MALSESDDENILLLLEDALECIFRLLFVVFFDFLLSLLIKLVVCERTRDADILALLVCALYCLLD